MANGKIKKKYAGRPAFCKQVPAEDGCVEFFGIKGHRGKCLMCRAEETKTMRLGPKIAVKQMEQAAV